MTLSELKQEAKNMIEKEFPTLTGTAKEMLVDATVETVIRKQLKEKEIAWHSEYLKNQKNHKKSLL